MSNVVAVENKYAETLLTGSELAKQLPEKMRELATILMVLDEVEAKIVTQAKDWGFKQGKTDNIRDFMESVIEDLRMKYENGLFQLQYSVFPEN